MDDSPNESTCERREALAKFHDDVVSYYLGVEALMTDVRREAFAWESDHAQRLFNGYKQDGHELNNRDFDFHVRLFRRAFAVDSPPGAWNREFSFGACYHEYAFFGTMHVVDSLDDPEMYGFSSPSDIYGKSEEIFDDLEQMQGRLHREAAIAERELESAARFGLPAPKIYVVEGKFTSVGDGLEFVMTAKQLRSKLDINPDTFKSYCDRAGLAPRGRGVSRPYSEDEIKRLLTWTSGNSSRTATVELSKSLMVEIRNPSSEIRNPSGVKPK